MNIRRTLRYVRFEDDTFALATFIAGADQKPIQHSDLIKSTNKPVVSAGYIKIGYDGILDKFKVKTFSKSITIDKEPAYQDAQLLEDIINNLFVFDD